jgi:hypothetical protein
MELKLKVSTSNEMMVLNDRQRNLTQYAGFTVLLQSLLKNKGQNTGQKN